uniref:Uncharacterized protein n=1 Tax=Plectus sambesii TaxID=2011161 RepID=A0A914WLK9_9BILA
MGKVSEGDIRMAMKINELKAAFKLGVSPNRSVVRPKQRDTSLLVDVSPQERSSTTSQCPKKPTAELHAQEATLSHITAAALCRSLQGGCEKHTTEMIL